MFEICVYGLACIGVISLAFLGFVWVVSSIIEKEKESFDEF